MTACYCDYDPAEFYNRATPVARKDHICEECRCTIRKGETYERVAGKWDGIVSMFLTCQRCIDLRTWVKAHVPCFCWAHGSLHEDAQETIEEYAHECPGLRFALGRKAVPIRRRAIADMKARRAARAA